MDVDAYLRRRYQGQIVDIQIVEKEDLDLVSQHVMIHTFYNIKLSNWNLTFLITMTEKPSFWTTKNLLKGIV